VKEKDGRTDSTKKKERGKGRQPPDPSQTKLKRSEAWGETVVPAQTRITERGRHLVGKGGGKMTARTEKHKRGPKGAEKVRAKQDSKATKSWESDKQYNTRTCFHTHCHSNRPTSPNPPPKRSTCPTNGARKASLEIRRERTDHGPLVGGESIESTPGAMKRKAYPIKHSTVNQSRHTLEQNLRARQPYTIEEGERLKCGSPQCTAPTPGSYSRVRRE